jgi:hypothetical protein
MLQSAYLVELETRMRRHASDEAMTAIASVVRKIEPLGVRIGDLSKDPRGTCLFTQGMLQAVQDAGDERGVAMYRWIASEGDRP